MNVVGQPIEHRRSLLDLTNDRVAASTKETAHAPVAMVMVEDQEPGRRPAEQATATLRDAHRFDLFGRHAVLAHEACPVVLGSSGVGVGSAPLTQAGIALGPVLRAVPPRSGIGAVPAIGPAVPARSREGGQREFAGAVGTAFRHAPIMPYQPCHADVLLELANREDAG